MIATPDPDALLVALVLCPGAYSRNRFYKLFATPDGAAIRRRAALVRSVVAELAHPDPLRRGRVVAIDTAQNNDYTSLTYVVSSLGLRRSTLLTALELSIIQYTVMRRVGVTEALDAGESTRERIEIALRGLAPELADSASWTFENDLFDDEADAESVLLDEHHQA
jgi:hypothetical protein